MSWGRFDDEYPEHPKVAPLSDQAFRLHVTAICRSARLLLDGLLSPGDMRVLLAMVGGTQELTQELMSAGLLEVTSIGWQIHDYLDYNPSREQVLRDRLAAAQRMRQRRSGQRSPEPSPDSAPECSGERQPNIPEKFGDPVPHPRPLPGVPRRNTSLPRLSPLVEQAVEIWNQEKHRRQPAVRKCPAGLASQLTDFLGELDGDVDAFRRSVRTFASDGFMNGTDERATKPLGLDTMVRKANRDKWIIAGQAEDSAPSPPPTVLRLPTPEQEAERDRQEKAEATQRELRYSHIKAFQPTVDTLLREAEPGVSLLLRDAHGWPWRDRAADLAMAGHGREEIVAALNRAIRDGAEPSDLARYVPEHTTTAARSAAG